MKLEQIQKVENSTNPITQFIKVTKSGKIKLRILKILTNIQYFIELIIELLEDEKPNHNSQKQPD